jgi:RHS repeat-associated protein
VTTAGDATTVSYSPGESTDRPALIRRTPTGGANQDLAFIYAGPALAQLTFAGPASGQYTYAYDAGFRLTRMDLSSGADTAPFAIAYDADGLPTTFGPFSLTRDGPGGLPTRIADGVGQFDLTFDAKNRLATRAAQVNGAALYAEQRTYDAAGRVARRVETVAGATSTYTYTYDLDSQLIAVAKDGAVVEQYTYDARGNRLSRRLGAAPAETATYDLQDRLGALAGTSYTFDGDGFLAARGADTFQFGARGELRNATVGGQTVTYTYDGFGRRTARTDVSGTYQYLYGNPEHQLQVTAARDPAGVLTAFLYDDGGRLVGLQRGGTRYYVATNALGSPVAVADAAGAAVKRLEWDAYGNVVSDSNPAFDLALGFAGGLRDPLTGFSRFGVRDYDPATGRWTARDAALFDGRQTNLYAYVANNPVNLVDLAGLYAIGGSAYDGIGGGFRVAVTGEGISFCAELGFGIGDAIEVNPFGELDKERAFTEVKLGVGGLGGEGSLTLEIDECNGMLRAKPKPKVCVTQFCAKGTSKEKISVHGEPSHLSHAHGWGDLKGFSKLFKVAGKFCVQEKW